MSSISERLIEARKDKGWKPADLRRAAKIKSPSTISEIESGKRKDSPQLAVIAEALGVETIWLQHGRGPKRRGDGDAISSTARRVVDSPVIALVPAPEKIEQEKRLTVAFSADERLVIDGFRLATPRDREHMLYMARLALEDFNRRSEQQT
jgi:transcriptional regulator with XRE-family HTH domain